ncbi:MAG: hypothetical protein KDD61_12135 [Bdellovibrionales bacterium]|nr:hypothetical protein [Bdellovibrionales bacterium]
MKNLLVIILLVTAYLSVGCSEENLPAAPAPAPIDDPYNPDGPYVPDGTGPGQGPGDNWEWGAAADLDIVSLSVMSDYTARPMNNPQDIKVNINLEKRGNGFGGVVTITYTENGNRYEGYFTSGSEAHDNRYNIFFTKQGKTVWHGFFEDYFGGMIVVIDDVIDLGDGDDQILAAGSVWFKNFGLTYAPHPPTHCWNVSLGPYDCRSWKSGEGVNTTAAINPTDGYVKLGTFENLNIGQAFNGEAQF